MAYAKDTHGVVFESELEIENHRAISHEDDRSRELPLFLDPTIDTPEDHIAWSGEVAKVFSLRGEETVGSCSNVHLS